MFKKRHLIVELHTHVTPGGETLVDRPYSVLHDVQVVEFGQTAQFGIYTQSKVKHKDKINIINKLHVYVDFFSDF